MEYFWYFVLYSALGFLLEVGYAWCTGGRRDRKRTLVLPLCPVYGLGALVVLALPEEILTHPLLLMVLGGTAATGVEYITAVFYEKVLGVSFWAALLPAAVYWVHPAVSGWVEAVPLTVTAAAVVAVGMDLLISALLLRRTGKRECLQWYRRESRKAFLDTSG